MTTAAGALVTALIPAYNAAATLDRALASVARQDYGPIEILVVDDASTDSTQAVLRPWTERGVRVITLSANRGECGAMNVAIREARGEFIAFLDADDEWHDGKIAKQMAVMADRPELSFVTCGGQFVLPDGTVSRRFLDRAAPCDGHECWRTLLAWSFNAKPCVLARRSALIAAGLFDERLVVAGDQDMWIKLALVGDGAFVVEVLATVHVTHGSLTQRHRASDAQFVLPMIEGHLRRLDGRLSTAEIRAIRGRRYATAGRNALANGAFAEGVGWIARAIAHGHEPIANALYVAHNVPAIRRVKDWLLGRIHARIG